MAKRILVDRINVCKVCGKLAQKKETVQIYYSKCEAHMEQHRRHNRSWKERHFK